MQPNEILAGISNIKYEFISGTRIQSDISKLTIEFFMHDHDLILRNKLNHEQSIVVAIYNPQIKTWRYLVTPGTAGRNVAEYFAKKYLIEKVAGQLNQWL